MLNRMRQAASSRLTRWSSRRHGRDGLPLRVNRRRIYIVPTRFGIALALLLMSMLLAGLNYNSNLGLAFGFLMTGLALVAMHHCHRNLLGLGVDATTTVDAFAGATARFEFLLRNDAAIERRDIEIRCADAAVVASRVPVGGYLAASIDLPVGRRGVTRVERFELRTRHPFGWFRAWTYVQCPLTAFVAPQPAGERALPPAVGTAGSAAQREAHGDEELSGLRAYEPGMALKHMAWKVLARGLAPAVRSYSGLSAQPEWLDWATLARLDDEARLAQLCRWVLAADAAQQRYGLRLPGLEIPPARGAAHRCACLRALAAFPGEAMLPFARAAARSGARSDLAQAVTLEQLLWVCGCLGLTLLAGLGALPLWVTLAVAGIAALRVGLAALGRNAPPRGLRIAVAVLAIGLLFAQFHTFNGLTPGSALLSLIAGLKLLETRTRRDIHVIVMIIYFLCLTRLLEGESFWLLCYLTGVSWLTTAALLRLGVKAHAGDRRRDIRYAGRLLGHALPLAFALWLLFPRLGGPLWEMPSADSGAASGLGDSMSPGDITDLALSDEVAFRVRFAGPAPPPEERYWRGPVLHDFDGHTWRRGEPAALRPPPLLVQGPAYRYTVSLEPSRRTWLFALDWPTQWDAPNALLTDDYMLVGSNVVTQPLDVTATSYGRVQASEPLTAVMRQHDTRLPAAPNPRSRHLALELRKVNPDAMAYVGAVLALFHRQAFFYTLTPPPLAADSVDSFLFDSRRGFCGHYASAFATLMRAAGIPARVVTGYQGGTYNRFADYWILRQSDAHAWDEVWIEGRGWWRVDPTAAVAPERVERGLNGAAAGGAPRADRWRQRVPWLIDIRLRIDALRVLWRESILQFDSNAQMRLLEWLHIPEPDGRKLALLLAACLIAGMTWLTWQVRRELRVRAADPVTRAYGRLCRRLAGIGIVRMPHEGAEALASRVSQLRPDLAAAVTALCREYCDLRYGASGAARGAGFPAAVRRFRPRRRAAAH